MYHRVRAPMLMLSLLALLVGGLLVAACAAPPTPAAQAPQAPAAQSPQQPAAQAPVQAAKTEAPKAATAVPAPKGPSGTLNLNGSEPENLDANVVDASGWGIMRQVHRTLVAFDKASSKILPAMAESWTVSPDALTYTFKLRKGVKWHKGYGEFTSDDVKFTIDRIKDPATKSLWKSNADAIKEVQTPDPYTVVVVLKEPQSSFLTQLVDKLGWIVSRKAVTDLGDKYPRNPIGTGPFVFEKWEPKGSITLTANPDYYEPGLPKIARVQIKFLSERAAELMTYLAGEFDVISEINPEDFKRIQGTPDKYKTYAVPVTGVTHIEINSKIPPLDKLEVRQALAHAIDYDSVNKATGDWVRVTSHLTPAFQCFKQGFPPAYEYNPEKAKELLAKAGFPNGIDIELWGSTGSAYHQAMDTAIEASWRKAGIRAKVQYAPNAVMTSKRRAGEAQTWSDKWVRAPDEHLMWWDKFHTTTFAEGKYPFTPQVNELLEAGRKELDPAKKCEIYQKLDNLVSYEQVLSIPIGIETRNNATQMWVSEFYDNGLQHGFAWEYVVVDKKQ